MMNLFLFSLSLLYQMNANEINVLNLTFITQDQSQIDYYISKEYILQVNRPPQEAGSEVLQLYDREKRILKTIDLGSNMACEVPISASIIGKNISVESSPVSAVKDSILAEIQIVQHGPDCIEEIRIRKQENAYFKTTIPLVQHDFYCKSEILDRYFLQKGDWAMAGIDRKLDAPTDHAWLFREYAYPADSPDYYIYQNRLSNVKEIKVNKKKFTDLLILPSIDCEEFHALRND